MTTPRRLRRPPHPQGRLPAAMLRALAAELSDPGRFSRAKAYARDGAVIDIVVEPGEVRGEVQGSRYEPYVATIYAGPAADGEGLLGLIPERSELVASCSCPDAETFGALQARPRRAAGAGRRDHHRARRCWHGGAAATRRPRRGGGAGPADDDSRVDVLAPLLAAPATAPGRGRDPTPAARRDGGDHRPPRRGRRGGGGRGHRGAARTLRGRSLEPRARAAHAASGGDPGRWVTGGTAAEPAASAAWGSRAQQALAALVGELEGGVGGDQVHGVFLGRPWERPPHDERTTDCGQFRSSFCGSCGIDTPARLLRLLVLFSTRPSWSAADLTDRLEVTARTLRRDVTRLRDLGYPIESTTGRHGGYALGAGGRLPPLLLDDDEAVAVTLGLRELSGTADPALGEAALAALAKVVQVMPSALRERVDDARRGDRAARPRPRARRRAGHRHRHPDGARPGRPARRPAALRLPHRRRPRRAAATSSRHRLVSLRNRWYLVGLRPRPRRLADVPRRPRRSTRSPPASRAPPGRRPTPPRSSPRASPCGSTTSRRASGFPVPPDVVGREIAPTVAVIQPGRPGATTTTVLMGGDLDWIATYLASLPFPFEVLDPPEVRAEVAAHARRLLSYVGATRRGLSTARARDQCSVGVEALAAAEHRQRAVRGHDEDDRRRLVGREPQRRGVAGAEVRARCGRDRSDERRCTPTVDDRAAAGRRARPGRTATGR